MKRGRLLTFLLSALKVLSAGGAERNTLFQLLKKDSSVSSSTSVCLTAP